MRRAFIVVSLLAAGAAWANGTPPPSCPVGSAWTQTWTNTAGDLTVTLTSPCSVIFNTDFVVTAAVTDTFCVPSNGWPDFVTVGTAYKITDTVLDGSNATSIIGGGGPGFIKVFDGQWLTTVKQHYGPVGTPTDHRIAFSFVPRDGNCAVDPHGMEAAVIGTTTYDPYATSTGSGTPPGDSGSASTGTGPAAPAASSGGCGSSGIAPAIIGLAALAIAARPRRRSP